MMSLKAGRLILSCFMAAVWAATTSPSACFAKAPLVINEKRTTAQLLEKSAEPEAQKKGVIDQSYSQNGYRLSIWARPPGSFLKQHAHLREYVSMTTSGYVFIPKGNIRVKGESGNIRIRPPGDSRFSSLAGPDGLTGWNIFFKLDPSKESIKSNTRLNVPKAIDMRPLDPGKDSMVLRSSHDDYVDVSVVLIRTKWAAPAADGDRVIFVNDGQLDVSVDKSRFKAPQRTLIVVYAGDSFSLVNRAHGQAVVVVAAIQPNKRSTNKKMPVR